ncbi:hypothetical protein AEST_04740 [Alishewanella aestuarii B11]|uniref:Uncharacterized protein n=1 Tax=Alishewanella aestuarii B11 TaxID=1197174 RepID=J1Q6W4_9ALTE|nr:hypothetical protein AEST_04740 [Alishewanella aestuarii B11]
MPVVNDYQAGQKPSQYLGYNTAAAYKLVQRTIPISMIAQT